MFLIGDTETTGLPRDGVGPRDPSQARVIQQALILLDEYGKEHGRVSFLIRPDDWVIGEGAFKAHGIPMERCEQFGVKSEDAFGCFCEMAEKASVFVAHNAPFDWRMFEIEAAAHKLKMPKLDLFCTMTRSNSVKGERSLGKVYERLTGQKAPENVHDALVDTELCLAIFRKVHKFKALPVVGADDFADLV